MMRKVYLEKRFAGSTSDDIDFDLNDIDMFIRSELEKYDNCESNFQNGSTALLEKPVDISSSNGIVQDQTPFIQNIMLDSDSYSNILTEESQQGNLESEYSTLKTICSNNIKHSSFSPPLYSQSAKNLLDNIPSHPFSSSASIYQENSSSLISALKSSEVHRHLTKSLRNSLYF